jgi:hypothetical protein
MKNIILLLPLNQVKPLMLRQEKLIQRARFVFLLVIQIQK